MVPQPSRQPQLPPIHQSYLICTTPRTGSNLLCEVLRRTGVAGCPDEYFCNPTFWQERWGTMVLRGYLARIRTEGTTSNGVFGAKLMWHELEAMLPKLAEVAGLASADPHAVLRATFPNLRYLWLTRRDKVRQAISWYRALETSIWRSTDQPAGSAADPAPEPAFDFEAIDQLVRQSVADDQAWQRFFQEYGITPLAVTYEALAEDPAGIAREILDHLGLPAPVEHWSPDWQHRQQADASTDDWVRRYHAEVVRPGPAPASTP